MPAGKYYVGDLCYVMHPQWDEFCELTISQHEVSDGEFTLANGTKFSFRGTAYGDGCYEDQFGGSYPVDAGLIGCILVDDINDPEADLEAGQIIEFTSPFETSYEDGVIYIGHLRINTGDEEYDEYEEDEIYEEDDN